MSTRALTSFSALALLAGCPVSFDDAAPPSGVPGAAALVRSTPEPPGERCAHGGMQLEHGLDADGDGVLSDAEVTGAPAFVCDGPPGAPLLAGLVEVSELDAGDECAHGGALVRTGHDADGDGVLDEAEVRTEQRVCHGAPGAPGAAVLVDVSPALPGADCARGGQRVRVGRDLDGDGALGDDEVALTRFVCDGAEGPTGEVGADPPLSLLVVVPEPAGDACPDGGVRVLSGVDYDGDGALGEDEVEAVGFVCDAAGEGIVLGSGRSEGSLAAPVPLALDLAAPRLSTVASLSTSFYAFTTAGPGAAPYRLEVYGEDSPLELRLLEEASGVDRALSCERDDERQRCAAVLEPGAAFLLEVREGSAAGNAFGLWLRLGRDEGTAEAPVPLTDELGVPLGARGSVGDRGESVFSLSPPADDAYTLALASLTASSAEPGLSWVLEDGHGELGFCDDASAPCATGFLRAGVSYRLVIRAARSGASFEPLLATGDSVTPVLPLNELLLIDDLALPEARVFQVSTTSSTAYTFRTFARFGGRYLTLFDAPPRTVGRHVDDVLDDPRADHDLAWLDPDFADPVVLEPERVYYAALVDYEDHPLPFELFVADRGGDESAVPVTVGQPHAGSVGRSSSYRFTAAAPGPFTITLDRPLGAHNTSTDLTLYDDDSGALLAERQWDSYDREGDDILFVTPPLLAGQELTLHYDTYTSQTYDLLVEAGDTLTTPLALGATPLALPAYGVAHLRLETEVAGAVSLAFEGAHVRAQLSESFPAAIGDPSRTLDAVLFCEGGGCAKQTALGVGRAYLTVENPLPIAQTVTVIRGAPPETLSLGAPVDTVVHAREQVRYVFVNEIERPVALRLQNPDGRAHVLVLRDADLGTITTFSSSTAADRTVRLPSGSSSDVLPAGTFVLEVRGGTSVYAPLRLTLSAP